MNGGRVQNPGLTPAQQALAADYTRRDPITGQMWFDRDGYLRELITARPGQQTPLNELLGSTRPLNGLEPNQLGMTVTFGPNEIGITKPFFRVPDRGAAELLSVTLSLDPQQQTDLSLGDPLDASDFKAILTWGTGGALSTATVDLIRSTCITLSASRLDVSVQRRLPFIPNSPPFLGYQVSASAGYTGVGHASAPARYTDFVGELAPGFTGFSVVPNFATSFTVVNDAGNAVGPPVFQPLVIDEFTSLSDPAALCSFELVSNDNRSINSENQFPVANNVQLLAIRNLGGASSFVTVIYALAL